MDQFQDWRWLAEVLIFPLVIWGVMTVRTELKSMNTSLMHLQNELHKITLRVTNRLTRLEVMRGLPPLYGDDDAADN